MLTDSHCHLDRIDLTPFNHDFSCFMQVAKDHQIERMLCIGIDLESFPAMCKRVADYESIAVTVGVHPNVQLVTEPGVDELVALGEKQCVVGIGETGLDYYRSEEQSIWQKARFRNHIRAAKQLKKPLIIHTRDAKQDTIDLLREENAGEVGGVIHCFTEDWEMAKQIMDLNFYVSFSGIVTFNSAKQIKEVAKKVPAERLLIETDSPYLAPVPFRGKPNYPTYVRYVAETIAELRGTTLHNIADITSANYYSLFLSN